MSSSRSNYVNVCAYLAFSNIGQFAFLLNFCHTALYRSFIFIMIFTECVKLGNNIVFRCSRPTGSELTVAAGLEGAKSRNPDHVGGYSVALPMFSGIESKFGLRFPKFSVQKQ